MVDRLQPAFSAASARMCHGAGMRVLVVEDDKQLAAALRRGLEGEGYAVDTALDGAEGEWLARENSYDALVLDIMLPSCAATSCARGGARRATGRRS